MKEGAVINEEAFVAFVDHAVPEVYHYLLRRVGDVPLAEDLTSETVLGAIDVSRRQGLVEGWSVAWLIGIARHKLVDHWRRQSREERKLTAVAGDLVDVTWDHPMEPGRAAEVMAQLNPSQRSALVLRYYDGLPVTQVAEIIGRSVAATENLLARSRRAFRTLYELEDGDDA